MAPAQRGHGRTAASEDPSPGSKRAPFLPRSDPPTCVGQVDDGQENHAGSYGDAQEEEGLELVAGQSVLQVLQEGVNLEQNKDACKRRQISAVRAPVWPGNSVAS